MPRIYEKTVQNIDDLRELAMDTFNENVNRVHLRKTANHSVLATNKINLLIANSSNFNNTFDFVIIVTYYYL